MTYSNTCTRKHVYVLHTAATIDSVYRGGLICPLRAMSRIVHDEYELKIKF